MSYLWSSPNPQGATPAQLQAGSQINPINMAGVVTAILEHQRMQQQMQQQYQAQLAQGVQALSQQYQQGQQDDLANRAIYSSQHPNDPYTGQPGYDDRVPDFGGVSGLHMQQIEAQLGNQGLNSRLINSKINAEDALGYDRWTYPAHAGRGTDAATELLRQQKEQRLQAAAELDAAKRAYSGATGLPTKDLSKAEDALNSYKQDQTAFPEIGSHKAISDASESEYKDRVLSARSQYKAALDKLQGLNSTPQSVSSSGGAMNAQIAQIRSAYKAGTMSRADASAALQALGIAP